MGEWRWKGEISGVTVGERPVILVFIHTYLPGERAGGPVRSVSQIVSRFDNEFTFRILTSDRDVGGKERYPGIDRDVWLPMGNAKIMYLSPERRRLASLAKFLRRLSFDGVYLPTFFHKRFSRDIMFLVGIGVLPHFRRRTVIAPSGEFHSGALAIKNYRKMGFLRLAVASGFYDDVIWRATSREEMSEIRYWFGQQAEVILAPHFISTGELRKSQRSREPKARGFIRMVFLSRVDKKKNLNGGLKFLRRLKGKVEFHIFGPLDDPGYWEICQSMIRSLPPNIRVDYRGVIPFSQVVEVLSGYDLFFLPTFGENFGHVIPEALMAGCPVLISDRTPWKDLEECGAGWSFPLEEPHRFEAALQACVDMDADVHSAMVRKATEYISRKAEEMNPEDRIRKVFRRLVEKSRRE